MGALSATSQAGKGPFDKRAVGRDFGRAAQRYEAHADLQRQVAGEVADALGARLGFEAPGVVADLGCGTGLLGRALRARDLRPDPLIQLDLAPAMAHQAAALRTPTLVGDAERLPLAAGRLDTVASSLTLQWCNDLDRVLGEVHRTLRPGGLFVAATVLEGTLGELARALEAVDGGPAPVGPFRSAEAVRESLARSDLAAAECRAVPRIRRASDPLHVLHELRGLGATAKGAPHPGGGGLGGRRRLQRLRAAYREATLTPAGPVPVTWNVALLVAWKPTRS